MPKTKTHKREEEKGKTFFDLSAEGYAIAGRSMSKGFKWSMAKLKKNLKK